METRALLSRPGGTREDGPPDPEGLNPGADGTAAGSADPPNGQVFVYGTLRRGGTNAHWMSEAEFLGEGCTLLPMALRIGEYPFVFEDIPLHRVHGDLYQVGPEMLAALDAFEGTPVLYHRKAVKILRQDGTATTAWMYLATRTRPADRASDSSKPPEPPARPESMLLDERHGKP